MARLFSQLILPVAFAATTPAYAGLCSMELQEEANVFEVNCQASHDCCDVVGYFSSPKWKPGYNGQVATLTLPESGKVMTQHRPRVTIRTYRNGTPKAATPVGFWAAVAAAESMLAGEQPFMLFYVHAESGRAVRTPKLKCVPDKS